MNRRDLEPGFSPRDVCWDCTRPTVACVCAVCEPVQVRTKVSIVQHVRERMHPLNTARLVEKSLTGARLLSGHLSQLERQLPKFLRPSSVLLFPGPRSIDIAEHGPIEELVVVDGTWSHARVLLRELPMLSALPQVRFSPDAPSEYRIRKEPAFDFLSTIESIRVALGVLEPETPGLDGILRPFRAMVDRNLALRPTAGTAGDRRRKTPRGQPTWTRALASAPDDLVVAAVETCGAPNGGEQILGVLLERLSGERLHVFRQPSGAIPPRLLARLGVTPTELAARALDQASARAVLEGFVRPTDHLLVWNHSTEAVLEATGLRTKGRTIALKTEYANHTVGHRGGHGTTAHVIERNRVPHAPRAGASIVEAQFDEVVSLARWLRDRAVTYWAARPEARS